MATCAISTSWRANQISSAKTLVETMKATGVPALELEFRISTGVFEKIKKNLSSWGAEVVSLHAVCPASYNGEGKRLDVHISDFEEEKRKLAVSQVKMTMQNTVEVGASAVVLHCGSVPMEEPIYKMMEFYDRGEIHSEQAKKKLQEIDSLRRIKSKSSFQRTLKSLEEISEEADRLNIDVGLENRYYFREIPDMEELETIFHRFRGSRLGYWHDTGHAHVRETLFGVSHKEVLDAFSKELIGIHLHDAIGYTDHYEPGCGEVDFEMVTNYLKKNTIRVMELNSRVDMEGAKRGVAFLMAKGIF